MESLFIYSMTSTDKKDSGLESQERALLNYCQSNGIEKPVSFADAGICEL